MSGSTRLGPSSVAAALLLALAAARPAAQPARPAKLMEGPYKRLIIRGATIVPGHGGPANGPADIVIEGNVIADIVPFDPVSAERRERGAERPAGDRVIDATGMYALPGLIDLHTHVRTEPLPIEWVYYLKLAHGVTMIVPAPDRGLDRAMDDARRSARGEIVAPRIYPIHNWRQGAKEAAAADDPARAREIARALADAGARVVSVGDLAWNPQLFGAACKAVWEAGGITTVHLPPSTMAQVNAVQAAELGVTMIEHHYGYAESALAGTVQDFPADYDYGDELARFRHAGKVWRQADVTRLMTEVVDRLVKSGVSMIPTMVVYEANRDIVRAMNLPWHEKYTHPALIQWSLPNPAYHGAYHYDWTSEDEATWAYVYRTWLPFINEFKNRGGRVGYATDDNYIWATPGFSNVRELQLLQEAGFHPLEAVKSATDHSANILREPRLGLVQRGYLADLFIVDANPLQNLRFLDATGAWTLDAAGRMVTGGGVKYTVKDSRVIDAPALMREVERLVREAKAPTSAAR
ncbi:MAG TPA: amidohydrolase family protein [Vicinamibacterales bacterium]|nr:amidohydrolase family protein [Vicinamibacterales bacterium]